jgi:orotate phosphoribosyltransferase
MAVLSQHELSSRPASPARSRLEETIEPYQERFIDLLSDHGAVRFGEFTLKSGRKSPYFINAGELRTGAAMARLGEAYAEKITSAGVDCDVIFGPSYKGVPLAVATAIAMSARGRDVAFCFDRKEPKDHGEGGLFVGTKPAAGMRVVLVDDVITSGLSIRRAAELVTGTAARVSAVVVAVDRQERGKGDRTTLEELQASLEVPVLPIVTIRDIVALLCRNEPAKRKAIEAYLEQYGA